MAGSSLFSKLDHVGMVVKDLNAAVEHLEYLGIGPFKPFNMVERRDTKLYGKPVNSDEVKLKIKLADIGGGVKVEVIQPLGEGPWQDFLKAGGEGIHHLAFAAENVDEQEAKLVQKGLTALYSVKFEGGGAAVYLDARVLGSLVDVIEIVKWAPGMLPW